MEFKALRVADLTEEVVTNLKSTLSTLPGITEFEITPETQEIRIVFDENQLGFRKLIDKMAKAGCPLQNIDAALLL